MTWLRQVRHVFVRDLRRTVGAFGLYVALLCIAVARAVEWPVAMQTFQRPMVLLFGCIAVVIIARIVLAESPTRVTAFWAIRPLHASAVATAKLLYVLVLIVLCGGAMLFTLTSWDLQAVAICLTASEDASRASRFGYGHEPRPLWSWWSSPCSAGLLPEHPA